MAHNPLVSNNLITSQIQIILGAKGAEDYELVTLYQAVIDQRVLAAAVTVTDKSANNQPVDAARYGDQNLVRDGAQDAGQFAGGRVLAKNGDGVAHGAGDTRNIQHAHVHANIADGGRPVAIDAEGSIAAAQVAVQSVRITNGNCGDDGAFLGMAPSAITDCVVGA